MGLRDTARRVCRSGEPRQRLGPRSTYEQSRRNPRITGSGAAQQRGRQFGLNEGQVSSALSALVPALAAGFQNNMSSPQGFEGLISALGGGQHQRYVDDPGVLGRADTTADGNGILGHIFGSKDVSRQVATRAAARRGLEKVS